MISRTFVMRVIAPHQSYSRPLASLLLVIWLLLVDADIVFGLGLAA
jgi:hypothetical protein